MRNEEPENLHTSRNNNNDQMKKYVMDEWEIWSEFKAFVSKPEFWIRETIWKVMGRWEFSIKICLYELKRGIVVDWINERMVDTRARDVSSSSAV